ncbi:MAG: hypothetical protein HN742_04280 [Lentisphaerae bacterium]|jgi:diacylglycerol kinase family enzyme|nr:hypothetical protein [Lentisphaerota bacterium]MBT4822057.1 hypothetical protein [Lentisphaerota bacterium]MBT5609145.1 hypothetical protein [Lentisphaerota bacterium]MBT7054175.1 hypothetical protein [Lentisphaerota bacterium]MBT7841061.1 hypothetical protein [Lentisphaerota bacterium]
MRLLLIKNPGSRAGRGKRLWDLWEAGLRGAGAAYRGVETTHVGHARQLAQAADDVDVVVAVGGDGTVNEVLDGLIQSGDPTRAMGVLYSGTSPDFCRFHRIPTDPEQALRALLSGHVRGVDVVRIAHGTGDGEQTVSHFGCSCSLGMGAAVARMANRSRWLLGDTLGTAQAVVRAVLAHRTHSIDFALDGDKLTLTQVNHVFVVKNPFIASGLKLDLEIAPDDGRLYFVGIHGFGRAQLLRSLPRFYDGTITSTENVIVRECSRVGASCSRPVGLEFDGDPRGCLPIDVALLPKALKLIGSDHG